MPGMTPERLAEIKARADAAPPGPWYVDVHAPTLNRLVLSEDHTLNIDFGYEGNRTEEEAVFVAHAREDVPTLLAEVERLRESVSWIEARGVVFALERDEARAAGDRVKALHSPKPGIRIVPCSLHAPHEAWPPGRCPDCTSEPTDVCSHCVGQASPCPTLRALDGGETP